MTISYFFSIRGDIFDYFVRKKREKKTAQLLDFDLHLERQSFYEKFCLIFHKILALFFL